MWLPSFSSLWDGSFYCHRFLSFVKVPFHYFIFLLSCILSYPYWEINADKRQWAKGCCNLCLRYLIEKTKARDCLSLLGQNFNETHHTDLAFIANDFANRTNIHHPSDLFWPDTQSHSLNAVWLARAFNAVTFLLSLPPTLLLSGKYFRNGRWPYWLWKRTWCY